MSFFKRRNPRGYLCEGGCRSHVQAAVEALGGAVLDKLSKSERSGWEWLATKQRTTSTEYAGSLKLPYRTAMNYLKRFQDLGLLEKSGSGRATEYMVRRT